MEYLYRFIVMDGKEIENLPITKHEKTTVYEVIRILEGTPLFLEKHFHRLNNSAKILNKNIPFSINELHFLIKKLTDLNKIILGNIKISLEYSEKKEPDHSFIGFISHSYPPPEEYKEGVKLISSITQRINPKAKVQNEKLRNDLNQIIKANEAYEVLLVHPAGYITEGSRSNIFFIQGDSIITSPDDQVLSGITRENVIQICRENNYKLFMKSLDYSELSSIDAAFLTGTSPKVLPIKVIDDFTFKLPNRLIQEIIKKYEDLILSYLATIKLDY